MGVGDECGRDGAEEGAKGGGSSLENEVEVRNSKENEGFYITLHGSGGLGEVGFADPHSLTSDPTFVRNSFLFLTVVQPLSE